MDLIDREALKKEAFKVSDCVFEDELNEMVVSIKSIDNAPKIETFTFDDMNKAQEVGYKAGKLEGKSERPHGKWVNISGFASECSICKTCEIFPNFNFCPNCGADMRGENNET